MRPLLSAIALAVILPALAPAQTPVIAPAPGGVVHAATLTRSAISPGSIVTIFGDNLAESTAAAGGFPLPTMLAGASVMIDGAPAPILYASPRQLNVQVPWSVLEDGEATRMARIVVMRGTAASAPAMVEAMPRSPGIFTLTAGGTGMAVAANADGTLAHTMTPMPGVMSRAAQIGSTVSIYATGLGAVTPSIAAGQAPLDLYRRTRTMPEVVIGGRPAQILFSGLAGGAAGVNQLNVVVPAGVTPGAAVPVQIRFGTASTSDRVTIAVDGSIEQELRLPGANAQDLWSFLGLQNYRQNYSLVPGKSQHYQGIAPHSQLLTVYMNSIARQAVERKAGSMPNGSVIIKDAHGPDGTLINSLLMYKIEGFDPANGDWYWSTRRPDGTTGASGSIQGCFGCHARSKTNDYLFLVTPVAAPAPNATAVRDYIAAQNYRETWRLWPGTMEFQPGGAPHGALVSIWVNEPAYDAIQNKAGRMPDGAVVIKENYMPDRTLAALTVMLKSPGYNPTAGNWFWLQQRPDGTAAAEGRVEGCITCHNTVASNDYLYTGSVTALPAPRAAAIGDYLRAQDYQKNWKLWPGTTAQAPSRAPHGATVTTYVNDIAFEAISRKRGAMPPGSIVVKENYGTDRALAAVTLMYKSEGFNPDRNDWYWLQRLANGTVGAEGRVAGCIGCHSSVATNDYIYLSPLR